MVGGGSNFLKKCLRSLRMAPYSWWNVAFLKKTLQNQAILNDKIDRGKPLTFPPSFLKQLHYHHQTFNCTMLIFLKAGGIMVLT